ncbi:hypothetical protein [Chitinophaga nivalis]|uniref:Uncharacterized protein n=1 Tax=Chitinophaga nivalis TaxID=2991709 RepID=A0ABT3IS66_9BACT|nr:hypothetical protein [Chitinophaga nivalis]MCW3463492.1 hypothetical protein [Chitinophaga nivalis]MCW3486818.1 hypothetical protein [Chitinophaga nivalis]
MENEDKDLNEEGKPLIQRLRNSAFPIKPTDSIAARILKNSAFCLFAVMALMVTLLLGGAIMFVL